MSFKKKRNSDPPVQIAIAPDEMVASIWKSVLEENGVPCFLKSINLAESIYVSPLTLRYQIMVMPENAAKAQELLAPFVESQEDEPAELENSDFGQEKENPS
ncbi:MAG TPA: DUF2007 domain-containing protein [Dehalococcoidales bacterium]|nr:DUF2007 domain-containing protein [Dehalococcoidales bacterium]